MIRAHVPESIPGLRQPRFLAALPTDASQLFQRIPFEEYNGIIERVEYIESAEYVIAPHEYADLRRNPDYFNRIQLLAKNARKRLIVSAFQDSNDRIALQNAIILRPGGYRSQRARNEITVPPYVEKIDGTPIGKGESPSIGFVGFAGYKSLQQWIHYCARNYFFRRGARRQGVYFRRRALAALARDSRVDLHAIVRRSYSANRKTIESDAQRLRREYLENLKSNLFALAPRGDGNFSLRFFEALAAGRIPILIDTDATLPLEEQIAYNDFVVRVPWQRTDDVGEIVFQWWSSRTEAQLLEAQKKARTAFNDYLYAPSFYRQIFTQEYLHSVPEI